MADDPAQAPEPWDAIDLDLAAEVRRLADGNLLSRSQTEELWAAFQSMEARVASRLQGASTNSKLSADDQLRARLRARMWLATAVEGAGAEHGRSVAIRRRIVDLEKSLGVFDQPTLVEPPTPEE